LKFRSRLLRRRLAAVIVVGLLVVACGPFARREYRVFRARLASRERQSDQVLAWLLPLSSGDLDRGEIQFLLARARRHSGQLGDATRHLERALALGHPAEEVRREQILGLAQSGSLSQVESALGDLLLQPGDDGTEICEAFAAGYFLNYQMGPGLRLIEAWERDYPRDPEPHMFRGRYYEHLMAWQDAAREYRRALELANNSIEARRSLGLMLVELNEFADAREQFDRWLDHAPRDVPALVGRARCLHVAGQDEAARADIARALEISPDAADALAALGGLELQAGKPAAAIPLLQRAMARDPRNAEIRYVLAGALQAGGDATAAREHFRFVDDARRADLQMHHDMQLLLTASAPLPSADELQLRFEIGSLALKYRDPADGVAWLYSVLQLDPDYEPAHRLLSEHFATAGNPALAAEHLRKANRIAGTNHGS
jgi:tetratricopeptide (TPR) repeat protein